MAEFKETIRQTGIQKKHSTGQNRSKKKTKTFLGQMLQIQNTKRTGPNPNVQNFKTKQ